MTDDEYNQRMALDRAAKAKSLLESELFREVMDGLETDLIEAWKNSPPNDADSRERAWMAVNVLRNIRSILDRYEVAGKFAEHALAALHPNKL